MAQVKQIHYVTQPDTGPLRVAAYCRVSSDSTDQLHSYAAQIRYYTDYIGQHPDWELADIYADEGLTGTKMDKRDDLKRLINDCRKGRVDQVIVKSVSRLTRNTYDCLALVRMLKGFGTSVFFEEQDLDTSKMGEELMLAALGMVAQGESMTISNNMRWSFQERMQRGELVGAAAYGYRFFSGQLMIKESEAAIVRRVFAMYLSGMGLKAIANLLTHEGVPQNAGRQRWYIGTVRYILTNERYIGDALLKKTYRTGFPFKQKRNLGQCEQYYVEDNHPAIISREQFEAAQQLYQARRGEGKSYRDAAHTLTGKLICPDCGQPFRRMMINGIPYWICGRNAGEYASCRRIRFSQDAVYASFLLLLNKLATNRTYILGSMISQLERMQSRNSVTHVKVGEVDRKIAELNQQIHILAQHKTRGFIDAVEFASQSGTINSQVSALRAERRKLLAADDDETLEQLQALDELLTAMPLQTAFDDEVFDQMIERIQVVSQQELCFCLTGGLCLPEAITYIKRGNKA